MTAETAGRFIPDGLPVLIGSVPLDSHEQALEWIFAATPEVPLWPQLPSNPMERMLPQFAEGLPCIVEEPGDEPGGRIYYDISRPGFEEEMLAFYEDYLAAMEDGAALDNSRFTTSRERARGLYLFTESLARRNNITAVKGQITGPFTMLTGIKDRDGRAGYFNDTIRDMVAKGCAMKAAWQTRFLARKSGVPVLMFIDEPALAGLGSSAFISVSTAEIQELVNEVADAVHQQGGLAGIHVCANTDWEILLGSRIDVLSFDAYGFFDRIAPLKTEVNDYLDRGGILAWGGIPTSRREDITAESTQSLVALWQDQADALVSPGRDKKDLLRQTLITPSCGTGSLSLELARRVLDLTRSVSMTLRDTFLG
ncbi:hypothetical protein [Desulfolithobacter sp.]